MISLCWVVRDECHYNCVGVHVRKSMGTRLHNICTQFFQSGWRSTMYTSMQLMCSYTCYTSTVVYSSVDFTCSVQFHNLILMVAFIGSIIKNNYHTQLHLQHNICYIKSHYSVVMAHVSQVAWYNNPHGDQGTVTWSWGAWWGVPPGGKRRGWSYGNHTLLQSSLNEQLIWSLVSSCRHWMIVPRLHKWLQCCVNTWCKNPTGASETSQFH